MVTIPWCLESELLGVLFHGVKSLSNSVACVPGVESLSCLVPCFPGCKLFRLIVYFLPGCEASELYVFLLSMEWGLSTFVGLSSMVRSWYYVGLCPWAWRLWHCKAFIPGYCSEVCFRPLSWLSTYVQNVKSSSCLAVCQAVVCLYP